MRIRLCMSKTRSIADNLRSIYFLKQHCRDNNIEAVLVSLDAKKAFDSVDHGYIEISKNPQQGAGRARANGGSMKLANHFFFLVRINLNLPRAGFEPGT